ncbi:hypothetical protein KOI35_42880 [Actinoplanes bogorensis]|uniref:DUF4129 domain-containing protein n=1 Tax=Paractinoplanes bogorensis TaxID=1610840 RepID=A0ABS5Z3L7_9ACTN|nr:hypothetical protein [Actinoplanes bogorensis]MBU2670268.1 hypothetical protein [Actinoplanes bogorensis]
MNTVAELMLADPKPMAIWAMLILLTFPALLMLGSPEAMRRPGRMMRDLVAALLGDELERDEQDHFASEVRVAAERAAAGAQRWRELWEQSETAVADAYQAWLDADARLRAATSAAAWGTPWSVRTCEEYAARERFLHRTVSSAAARGDLPPTAVADALAGRNGWDARLHPVDQELVIARASVAWLRQRYEAARLTEQRTWHDAELSRRTAASLADEARTAAASPSVTARGPRARAAIVAARRRAAVPA